MYSKKNSKGHSTDYGTPYTMETKRVSMSKSKVPERVRNLVSANPTIVSKDLGQKPPVLKR